MKIKLKRREINILNRMVCQPDTIPLPTNPTLPHPPYEAKDRSGAKELRKLIKFIRNKVMNQTAEQTWEIPSEWVGGIKQTFVDRLLEIVTHYQALGMSSNWVEEYWQIRDQLEGKKLDDDVDEVSEEIEKEEETDEKEDPEPMVEQGEN